MSKQRSQCYFTKTQTNIIKGIAICFMFVHHFFTFPDKLVVEISYPYIDWFATHFCNATKICVPIFSFLTGYLYNYQIEKSLKSSCKKICHFLFCYWIVYFPLLAIAMALGTYPYGLKRILLEMIGIGCPVMIHCWYVTFFIIIMILLPIVHYIFTHNRLCFVTCVVSCYCACQIVNHEIAIHSLENGYIYIFQYIWSYMPVVLIGYWLAGNGVFEIIGTKFHNLPRLVQRVVSVIAIIVAVYLRMIPLFGKIEKYITLDVLIGPLFVWGVVELTKNRENTVCYIFSVLGKYSMFMWFIHCVFHNCAKEFTQWLLYWPQFPVLVLIWGIIFCLTFSIIASRVSEKVYSYYYNYLQRNSSTMVRNPTESP